MGWGSSLKKAFKKVAKTAKSGGGLLGNDESGRKAPDVAPQVQTAQAVTEPPKTEKEDLDESDTESSKKAAKRGGKKGLSVARSSGSGLNI